jgi:hypothetical protein
MAYRGGLSPACLEYAGDKPPRYGVG